MVAFTTAVHAWRLARWNSPSAIGAWRRMREWATHVGHSKAWPSASLNLKCAGARRKPSRPSKKKPNQEERASSPSVTTCRPMSSCRAMTRAISFSSKASYSPSGRRPSCKARPPSLSARGLSRLPMTSARKGGWRSAIFSMGSISRNPGLTFVSGYPSREPVDPSLRPEGPMHRITTLEELDALYGEPVTAAITKEIDYISDHYKPFIDKAPLVVVATVGPDGMDCSPRGDPAGFVRVRDKKTVLIPDRRGNNRVD